MSKDRQIKTLDKDKILSSPAKRIIYDCMMQNIGLKEAAKQANLQYSTAKSYVTKYNLKSLVEQEQLKIAEKSGITVGYLQKKLLETAEECRRLNKHSVARACYSDLLKTIGGFTADAPHNKALELKRLDASRAKELNKAIMTVMADKYLAAGQPEGLKPVNVVDITQEATGSDLSGDNARRRAKCGPGHKNKPDSVLLPVIDSAEETNE